MTLNYSNPDSLTELSTLVERTLLDSGRLFRKNGSMPSSTHMQRSIPSYYESFQLALDNLSEQIFIAKAFLEKDYEAIQAREAAPQPTQDVAMNDVDQSAAAAAQVQPSPPIVEKASSPEKIDLKREEPAAAEPEVATTVIPDVQPQTEPQPQPQPNEEKVPVSVSVKEENEPNAAAAAAATAPPPTEQGMAGPEGINFDSVLNDTGGANSFDLNLDFGNDDMGNQAFLSGSTFSAGLPGSEKPNTTMPENSMSTPTGGGAFDMELQKTDGDSNMFPEQGTGNDDIMAPGESSFDDLFMETDNFGEGGDLNHLEGDSLMNISELDDNWFN